MEIFMLKDLLNLFLDVFDFHLIEHDDLMIRLFLQTLSGQAYEWYTSLPKRSIGSFDDLIMIFLNMFSPPVMYHNLLTKFTQICLKKNERIIYFNFRFNKTLNKIHEEKRPNDPVILGCYKNALSYNVKLAIRDSQIETLDEAISKDTHMEEIMIETDIDPNIILGRVQRHMDSLNIVDQGAYSSKKNEDKCPLPGETQVVDGGLFKGIISDVRTNQVAAPEIKKRMEIDQMNKTIRQM
jgi:hypothetical protein